jgi:hypothetical protein
MECSECKRLLEEYENLESRYAAIAMEYARLDAAAAAAKLQCETAIKELERHKLMHSEPPLTMRAQ